jgi:AraC-like DNA-binding protein
MKTVTAGEGVHGGSRYEERTPRPELASLLSSVWVQQISPDAPPYAHLNVPNGCVELVCRVGDTPQIVGPLTRGAVELLAPGSTVVGVRFRPGAAAALLGLSPSELVDDTVAADAVWGRALVEVGERIALCPTPDEGMALIEQFIAGRAAVVAGPDPLVAEAVRRLMPWGVQDVGSLRTSLFISERQFRRRLESSIGLAPKTLHRVLRFQGFLALAQFAVSKGRDPASDGLGSLAAESGYADQSHLTRECARLAGVPPKAFLHQMTHQCGPDHHHEVSFAPVLSARRLARAH